ncbi:three-Cys-motif partner protein TcmP [Parafrankia discariae]|uniref:three-Cys-motif partner protein TcmP n=1 Tax=Parafrankia discariae TaxID=365528 RepID=UPI00037A85FE|nr:three-Cys-motif partner protein TcmP [Parafrankia discariae]
MAVPTGVRWARDPHTAAKHDLLRRYLQAWYPIIFSGRERAAYVEGFAGPGVYLDDLPGSPIVALDVFLDSPTLMRGGRLEVVLLEAHTGRFAELRRRIDTRLTERGRPAALVPTIRRGKCGHDLLPLLHELGVFGSAAFVFLDSFGGPDVPHDLVRAIAGNPSSEVLVTFGTSFPTRFGQIDKHAATADKVFGSPEWRAVQHVPPSRKKEFLLDQYRASLNRAGFSFTLAFEMVDEGGRPLFLVFGTSHESGLKAMKDAMWKVDPLTGVRYRDPRDVAQQLLDLKIEPETRPLQNAIMNVIAESGPMTVANLRRFALLNTVFRPEHVGTALRELRKAGRLHQSPGRPNPNTVIGLPTSESPVSQQPTLF